MKTLDDLTEEILAQAVEAEVYPPQDIAAKKLETLRVTEILIEKGYALTDTDDLLHIGTCYIATAPYESQSLKLEMMTDENIGVLAAAVVGRNDLGWGVYHIPEPASEVEYGKVIPTHESHLYEQSERERFLRPTLH